MKRVNCKVGKFTVDFELRNRITVIEGDSATGKSFVCFLLRQINNGESIILNLDLLKSVGGADMVQPLLNLESNKVIIIDQAKEIELEFPNFLNTIFKSNNFFLVIGRGLWLQCGSYADLKFNNDKFTLEYKEDLYGDKDFY